MKVQKEYTYSATISPLVHEIHQILRNRKLTVMEVCGTHTMAIARHAIRPLLPAGLKLVSGPGCPVCVTPVSFIDHAVRLSHLPDVIMATFGDLVRVPGSRDSLEQARESGAAVKIVTSALQAVTLAEKETKKKVIFLGIGFETTIPTIAAAVQYAAVRKVPNFFVLSAHKTMPRAMAALCQGSLHVNAFLCPGHVSAITGLAFYQEIVRDYQTGCVITGFEPCDILEAIVMICRQFDAGAARVENQYRRVVMEEGNPAARQVMHTVFESCDSEWRGLGIISGSGMKIREEYKTFDAAIQFPVQSESAEDPPGCLCGQVLTGQISPCECPLFGNRCTVDTPVGPCMVSAEGTCAAVYQYPEESTHEEQSDGRIYDGCA